MSEELKPCPWPDCCRSLISIYSEIASDKTVEYWCKCHWCNATGPRCGTKEKAIAAWNRRASVWIPTSERMPNKSGWYYVGFRSIAPSESWCDFLEFDTQHSCWKTLPYLKPAYWMEPPPLPEPP